MLKKEEEIIEEILEEILENWQTPSLSDVFFGQEIIKVMQLLKKNSNHQTRWPVVTNSLIVLTALSYE